MFGENLQGKLYVRGDSKIFRFQNGKTESLFLQRKNPRRIAWTVLFRRMHKKGISEVSSSPAVLSAIRDFQCGRHRRARQLREKEEGWNRLLGPRKPEIYPWGPLADKIGNSVGSRKEANPPHRQAPACHRRCVPRRDQGAPIATSRSPPSRPSSRHQGIQGQEGRGGEQEEG